MATNPKTIEPKSIQTWGKKVRYLGAAHSGTGAARIMHLTSVALMPLAIAFVWILARMSRMDFSEARAELGSIGPAILMILFVGAALWHMKVGMQSIVDDYIHDKHLKEASLLANTFVAVVLAACCFYAILRMGFTPV